MEEETSLLVLVPAGIAAVIEVIIFYLFVTLLLYLVLENMESIEVTNQLVKWPTKIYSKLKEL